MPKSLVRGGPATFGCTSSAYFAYSQGFIFQGRVELYLGIFEKGTTFKTHIYCMKIDVDHVFCHVVPL